MSASPRPKTTAGTLIGVVVALFLGGFERGWHLSLVDTHQRPQTLTPEQVAEDIRSTGNRVWHAISQISATSRVSSPLGVLASRSEAVVLFPLGRRLLALAEPASSSINAALQKACAELTVNFTCPNAHIITREREPGIATLPIGPLGKSYAVFITGGLQEVASRSALAALLAREIALLNAHYVHVPELWQLLRAIRRRPKKPSNFGRRRSNSNSALPSAEQVLKQCVELCRLHFGLRWIASHTGELPPELQEATSRLLARAAETAGIPLAAGDAMDAVAVASDGGSLAGAKSAWDGATALEERRQLRRIWRINMLAWDLGLSEPGEFAPAEAKRDLDRIYWIGPKRAEGILRFLTTLRHPGRHMRRSTAVAASSRKVPSAQLVLMVLLATRRWLELSADRAAAKVVGDFMPVVAGLVEVYGTDLDRRRLHRGELTGLIQDAQAEQVPAAKWAIWWRSLVKNYMHPPLQLRIAELAAWAANEPGQQRLSSWHSAR